MAGGIHALHGVRPWLDPSKASTYLLNGTMDASRWGQVGVVTLIWVVALLASGALRLRRQEIT
jgi:hypothetical protein